MFRFAQREGAIILSGDVGFGNLMHYPVGTHCGIVVAHFPNEVSTSELNGQIAKALDSLTEADLSRNLVILEPGKIRIRRK